MLRGASLGASVADNLIVLERRQLHRAGVFLPQSVDRYGRRLTQEFDIDGALDVPLSRLSGGNIQKVILGRELAEHPRLLIICEPSWGLDARSRQMVVERVRIAARNGAAVLVLSTDVDEALEFADRVGVLYDGALSGPFSAADLSHTHLARLVFGSKTGQENDNGG
jgi:simple sugar transport system ATP-binding protein